MDSTNQKQQPRSLRTILPVILRITFSLILWTLGATMYIAAVQTNEHREVTDLPIDRARIEALSTKSSPVPERAEIITRDTFE